MNELKPLQKLLAGVQVAPATLEFQVSEDWLQGRSTFGGAQAALALAAMRRLGGVAAPLRALQAAFMAPVPQGAVHVTARPLRAGKSVTHVEARIESEAGTAALFVGVFGAARASRIQVPASQAAPPPGPQHLPDVPFVPGAPNVMQHYAMRWAAGAPPFSGAPTAATRIWLRPRDAALDTGEFGEHAAELTVVAMADAVPSPCLSWLTRPAPASTLTWSLEVFAPITAPGEAYWRVDSLIHAAGEGYVTQTATLFDGDQLPVALSHQRVVIFDA